MSPDRNLDRIFASHPDHLATGEATLSAVYPDARNPFAFPDLLEAGHEPWTVDEVLLTVHGESNRWVDVTDTFDRKIAALLAHESQHADPGRLEPLLRAWGAANAEEGGLGPGRLAEAFRAVDVNPF
jgi:LmbE family N-acetylglucosaminyl deacetylase